MRKRNLLFLFTDEQRPDTMSAYGNAKIDTPNLNCLAGESVVFEKCYVTQPVCTPSRSSLLTGLWPHTNGCTRNNIALAEDTPCLPEMVSGYRTAYFGKWHLGDEVFSQHGFEHWVSIEDMYASHYREGRDRNARSSYHHWLVDKGYTPKGAEPGLFSRDFAAHLPEEHCKPWFLAEQASKWLHARDPREPFIAYVNFLEPHMPFTGPRDNQYPLDFVDTPPNFNDVPGAGDHLKTRMLAAAYRHDGYGGVPLGDEAGWRRLIANYWGLVSQVDGAVGTILETLSACGLDDNTVVVFTSDHGDMMGSHRLLAKTVMYEESVTTPLLIKAPGLKPRGELCPISQIDLVPTLLDLLGASGPDGLQGKSLRPLLETRRLPEPRDVFIEWSGTDSGVGFLEKAQADLPDYLAALGSREELQKALRDPLRTVVTPDRWKFTLSPGLGQHALYNLKDDPYERRNLYGVAEHQPRIDALRRRMAAWGVRSGDAVAASA